MKQCLSELMCNQTQKALFPNIVSAVWKSLKYPMITLTAYETKRQDRYIKLLYLT